MKNIKLNSQLMIHNIIILNFILIQCNFKEPLEFITVNIFLKTLRNYLKLMKYNFARLETIDN